MTFVVINGKEYESDTGRWMGQGVVVVEWGYGRGRKRSWGKGVRNSEKGSWQNREGGTAANVKPDVECKQGRGEPEMWGSPWLKAERTGRGATRCLCGGTGPCCCLW